MPGVIFALVAPGGERDVVSSLHAANGAKAASLSEIRTMPVRLTLARIVLV